MFSCIRRYDHEPAFVPPFISHHKAELFLLVTALALAALGAFAFGQVGLVKDFSKTLKISLVAGGGGVALILACYLKYHLSRPGVSLSERVTDARRKSTILLVIALGAAVLGAFAFGKVGLVQDFSQPLKISLVAGGGGLALILACYIKNCLSAPPGPPPLNVPPLGNPEGSRRLDEEIERMRRARRAPQAQPVSPPLTDEEALQAAIRASLAEGDDPELRLAIQSSLDHSQDARSASDVREPAAILDRPVMVDKYFIKLKGFDELQNPCYFQSVICNPHARIDAIKMQIQAVTGYPASDQRLIYKGTILEDDKTLASYKIPSRETLFVVKKANT
jgi:hypothetical protein